MIALHSSQDMISQATRDILRHVISKRSADGEENIVCVVCHNHFYIYNIKYRRVHGRSQEFSKGGSHWVKQYRHGVFATEYCRLFA